MHTVLVIGGYGFFGTRICTSLSRENGIRLVIGGRNHTKALALAKSLGLSADQAVEIDANDPNLVSRLRQLAVDTLIHTAGPFQKQDYFVARAAIDARCHYIDLADSRDFVCGIDSLHQAALQAKVSVISGASSVPALASAAIDQLKIHFSRIESIRVGIGSGARAPGIATVRAVFSYCGKPIRRWENGQWVTTYGWLDLIRHNFPAPVGRRFLGSCEVPDLDLFPKRYHGVRTVTFHAGFASNMGHLTVWFLAQLVRIHLLPSLVFLAPLLNRLSRAIEPWVSDKGAMFVCLDGTGHDSKPLSKTWSLIAERNHGPHIPCGAAIALVRKLASDASLPRGAMPCVGLLNVEEYLSPLRDLAIHEVAE